MVSQIKTFFRLDTSGIVTLISDMGTKDYFLASIKGSILSDFQDAKVVDITHEVDPFDISQAAFILKNCYFDFPKGTVHIIGINPELGAETNHVLVKHNGHYFIGADNGIYSLLFDEIPQDIFELNIEQGTDDLTFPMRDVFVKAACHLLRGGTPELIAKRQNTLKQVLSYQPIINDDSIRGTVIYIDSYGNIITNITLDKFKSVGKTRPFTIFFRSVEYSIDTISKAYNEVPEGEKLAIFTTSGYLQVSINKGVDKSGGGANKLFGIKLSDTVVVEFSNQFI